MKHRGEYVFIGGIKQWISFDSSKQANPLILFLHGGPGWVMTPLLQHYCKPIFENYLVVNWDQRGSGRSYKFSQRNNLSVDQMVADGLELSRMLCRKFQKEKIILVGHSWGSALGVLMCRTDPGLFYKYIEIGQVGNWLQGENISFDYVLEMAKLSGKKRLIKKLERISPPPYKTITDLMLQRNWLLRFGGSIHGKRNYLHLLPSYITSDEYSFPDLIKTGIGLRYSLSALWDECMSIDLTVQAPALEVPVYFISGRFDMQVPASTSKAYFDRLEARHKEWFWLEISAHIPMFEEPAEFNALMLNQVLPLLQHPV